MAKVILSNPLLGEKPFEKTHAERILAYDAKRNLTNWTLHDKKLKFKDGKIVSNPSTGVNNDTQEQGENSGSN